MQNEATDGALQVAAARFQKRVRGRVLASVVLLALGGWLLYSGISEDQAVSKTFGIVFLVYAGIMQARIYSAKRFIRDVRAELEHKAGD